MCESFAPGGAEACVYARDLRRVDVRHARGLGRLRECVFELFHGVGECADRIAVQVFPCVSGWPGSAATGKRRSIRVSLSVSIIVYRRFTETGFFKLTIGLKIVYFVNHG